MIAAPYQKSDASDTGLLYLIVRVAYATLALCYGE